VRHRPQLIHETMLKTHYGDKLAGHVRRGDSGRPAAGLRQRIRRATDTPPVCVFRP